MQRTTSAIDRSLEPMRFVPEDAADETRRSHEELQMASRRLSTDMRAKDPLMAETHHQMGQAMHALDRLALQEAHHNDLRKTVAAARNFASEKAYEAKRAAIGYDELVRRNESGAAHANEVHQSKMHAAAAASAADEATAKSIAAHAQVKRSESAMTSSLHDARTSLRSARAAVEIAAAHSVHHDALLEIDSRLEKASRPLAHRDDTVPVARDCGYLHSSTILDSLKRVDAGVGPACLGFAATVRDGSTLLSQVQCAPLKDGTCPTMFDPAVCKAVDLRVADLDLAPF